MNEFITIKDPSELKANAFYEQMVRQPDRRVAHLDYTNYFYVDPGRNVVYVDDPARVAADELADWFTDGREVRELTDDEARALVVSFLEGILTGFRGDDIEIAGEAYGQEPAGSAGLVFLAAVSAYNPSGELKHDEDGYDYSDMWKD